MATTCRALLKRLGTKLHACASRFRNRSFVPASSTASSALLSILAVLLCSTTALSRVFVFFLPLVVSTSICCAAVYLLVAGSEPSEGGGAVKEVVLLRGGKAEVGLLQVYGEANASAYGGRRDVQVGCFLHHRPGAGAGGWMKRGVNEDGEDVVFVGRLATAAGGGQGDGAALEEELVALQVDRIAEGVWDSYFGGCSRWNYYVTARPGEEVEHHYLS